MGNDDDDDDDDDDVPHPQAGGLDTFYQFLPGQYPNGSFCLFIFIQTAGNYSHQNAYPQQSIHHSLVNN